MARLRKAGRKWRVVEAGGAGRAMVECAGYFTMEPDSLFGRIAPLEVEIGAGRGDFIIDRAARLPERNFLAIELAKALSQLLATRAAYAELQNLRILNLDARPLVNLFLPDCSVSAYHIYFPDPWPKTRHTKHRLFTPSFAANLSRTLQARALLYIATDVRAYAESIFSTVEAQGLQRTNDPVPGIAVSGFARKFTAEARPVYAQAFVK
jgi:tRNA (guanine-N7-)-methyltransferase